MTSSGRTYAGRSSDDRKADRRERLLASALALVGSEGLSGLTVRGISARAGLTPRYFYEEFGTADELARQLFDREFDAILTRVGAAVAAVELPATPRRVDGGATAGAGPGATADGALTLARVDAAVGAVLDAVAEDPSRAALLLTEASGAGVLAARSAERMEDVIVVVAAFGRATYAGEGDGARPPGEGSGRGGEAGDAATQGAAAGDPDALAEGDRALRVAATFVAGGLAQTIDAWLRGHVPGTREALQRDLAAEIVAVGDAAFARLRSWRPER